MNSLLSLGVVGVFGMALCIALLVAFPVWLYHRRETMRIRGTNEKDMKKLRERIEVLEKRCAKLDEQVASAHILLADEQRAMDKKLSKIIPESASMIPDEDESGPARKVKARDRARD
ncbi:MAG TPA: LapA family protein [Planctomycetota bacterium]|nr:LapA family protein [Planctomycetota bacterium]